MERRIPCSEIVLLPSSIMIPEIVTELEVIALACPVRTNGRKYSGSGDLPGLVVLLSLGDVVL